MRAHGQGTCTKIELHGEVDAGKSWSAAIGQGWAFSLVPIAPSGRGYTGWDLAIDREDGTGKVSAGYPDALLLGTPPYGSLNEREIGTTYGLRAQDAIAWSPRKFHFLTSEKELVRARELYRALMADPRNSSAPELMGIVGNQNNLGVGELSIEDARLTAGAGDPPVFARQWAAHLGRVPHTLVQGNGEPQVRGELRSIRFAVTLWVHEPWKWSAKLAQQASFSSAKCAE